MEEKILKRMQDNFKQTRQSLLDLASPLPDDAFEGLSELEIFFNTVAKAAGQKELERITSLARDKIANDLDLIDDDSFAFCWIVDYPMFEKDEQTNKIKFSHNPFSMPQGCL